MCKTTRFITMLAASIAATALFLAPVAAQSDDDSFSSFDSDFSSFDSGSESGASTLPVTVNGNAKVDMRAYVDSETRDNNDNAVSAVPSLSLDLGYSANSADVQAKLFVSKDAVLLYPEDTLKELTMRAYLGDFVLEVGKMNLVWGKGDKLHVLDNFNANDYTDFIIPDYLDRRLAEPMLHGVWNSSGGIRAEVVYAPMMTADRSASSGLWTPAAATTLTSCVTEVLGTQATAALINNSAADLMSIMNKSDTIVPNTKTLEYGQAGARITGSAGLFDWGVSYYYGHYKQPSVDLSGYYATKNVSESAKNNAFMSAITNGKTNDEAIALATAAYLQSYVTAGDSALPSLHYDMLQVFGLEGAAALGRFNFRAEAAYYLTKDTDGDDPWVHNNSVQWLFGFDVDLPVHNVNLNVQTVGKYLLKHDDLSNFDVDYDKNDCYTNNRIVFNVSDTYLHEKLKLECSVLWGIERNDILVMPKISYTIADGMKISTSGLYITGDDESEFAAWQDNSFVQISAQYQF